MLDVADLLVHQPLPRSGRVGIVTNVGGPAVMCADALEARGLQVPTLSAESQARLREVLPAEASLANPVDMLAAGTAEQYALAVRAVADDPNVDSVIAIFLPPLATRSEDVARAVAAAADGVKPVLGVFMTAGDLPDLPSVPGYHTPEPAAIALAHAVHYAEWLGRPVEPPVTFDDLERDAAGLLLAEELHHGGGWLNPDDVRRLLSLYGIPLVEQRVVSNAAQAAGAAEELQGPVALKVIAPGVVHKTEAGGVRLYLNGASPTREAAQTMAATVREATGHEPIGFVVQRMAPAGVEMLVGVVNDSQFGPTVACGAGGTLVELLNDVSVRLAPLTRADASSMVRELRSFPMLDGYRGARKCAVGALEDVLLRIGALAEDHPEIAEIDCNPVIVSAAGALVVDARVRIEAVTPPRPLGARR
jgi:acyl-CoA synthetase (NDP forming)